MTAMTATRRLRAAESAAVGFMRALRCAFQEDPEEYQPEDPWGDEGMEEFELEEDWGPGEEEPGLEGLGSFLKKVAHTISKIATAPIRLVSPKLADNLQKIDNKVIDTVDAIHTKVGDALHKVGHALAKNWKWVVVIAAIAITIYTMGAGATIAAKMLSGLQALGHAIATGATAVAHAVGIGTAGTAASGTSWLATSGKLALSAAAALSQQKAKVSDLSQAQAQALMEAQAAGYNMGADDPQLEAALAQRAQIPGSGIPTDALGHPLVNPSQVGAGVLLADGSVVPMGSPEAQAALGSPTATGAVPGVAPAVGIVPMGGYGGGGGVGFGGPSATPSWLVPAALGGGVLLLALAMR